MCLSYMCLENEGDECFIGDVASERISAEACLDGKGVFFEFDRKSIEIRRSEYIIR